jgi:preprotein translocase subunit SecF
MEFNKYLIIVIVIALILIYYLYTQNKKNEGMLNKSLYIMSKFVDEKRVENKPVEINELKDKLSTIKLGDYDDTNKNTILNEFKSEEPRKNIHKLNEVDKEDIYRQYGVKID